jgi:hypothetical protein
MINDAAITNCAILIRNNESGSPVTKRSKPVK